jgi:hypothetical protein
MTRLRPWNEELSQFTPLTPEERAARREKIEQAETQRRERLEQLAAGLESAPIAKPVAPAKARESSRLGDFLAAGIYAQAGQAERAQEIAERYGGSVPEAKQADTDDLAKLGPQEALAALEDRFEKLGESDFWAVRDSQWYGELPARLQALADEALAEVADRRGLISGRLSERELDELAGENEDDYLDEEED